MALPKTYKGITKLLIEIAEHGNDFNFTSVITEEERSLFGWVIADIQNWLGENDELLEKLELKYKSF